MGVSRADLWLYEEGGSEPNGQENRIRLTLRGREPTCWMTLGKELTSLSLSFPIYKTEIITVDQIMSLLYSKSSSGI